MIKIPAVIHILIPENNTVTESGHGHWCGLVTEGVSARGTM